MTWKGLQVWQCGQGFRAEGKHRLSKGGQDTHLTKSGRFAVKTTTVDAEAKVDTAWESLKGMLRCDDEVGNSLLQVEDPP